MIFSTLLSNAIAPSVNAQPLPQLSAQIASSISFDTSTSLFTYEYVVRSNAQSTGDVASLSLDISRSPQSVTFSSAGLTIPRKKTGTLSKPFDQALVPGTTVQLIPIGMQRPPGWLTGISITGFAHWGSGTGTLDIKAGQTFGGFAVISRGPPGIRNATLFPHYFFTAATGETTQEDLDRGDQIEAQITFNAKVIGPDAPLSLEPTTLLDRLISLKHQSVTLGWLRGEEFIKDLDEKLDQATKALADNKPFEANHKLREFIQKLEEQRKEQLKRQHEASEEGREERAEHSEDDKKFVNDNAFYLLKSNAEFIMVKLPGKPEEKDDDKDSKDHDH